MSEVQKEIDKLKERVDTLERELLWQKQHHNNNVYYWTPAVTELPAGTVVKTTIQVPEVEGP
jgi:hypothetical protein